MREFGPTRNQAHLNEQSCIGTNKKWTERVSGLTRCFKLQGFRTLTASGVKLLSKPSLDKYSVENGYKSAVVYQLLQNVLGIWIDYKLVKTNSMSSLALGPKRNGPRGSLDCLDVSSFKVSGKPGE